MDKDSGRERDQPPGLASAVVRAGEVEEVERQELERPEDRIEELPGDQQAEERHEGLRLEGAPALGAGRAEEGGDGGAAVQGRQGQEVEDAEEEVEGEEERKGHDGAGSGAAGR